jgi:hypothetical protein
MSEILNEVIEQRMNERGSRKAAVWLVDAYLNKTVGLTSADLTDSATFASGVDAIEECLETGDYEDAKMIAEDTAQEMLSNEGFDPDSEQD